MKKSIRYLYTFVLLISCSLVFTLQGQAQGTLSGTVTDSESGGVLIGVNILLIGEDMGVATDENGEFEFTNVSSGTYTLSARYIGYNTYEQQVSISDGEETVVNIGLNESTLQPGDVVVTAFG